MTRVFSDWIELQLRPPLSKSGLAKAIGKDRAQVTRIINGTRPVRLKELSAIVKYLGREIPPEILTEVGLDVLAYNAGSIELEVRSDATVSTLKLAPVRGEVAAGRWIEAEDIGQDDSAMTIPYAAHSFGANVEQFAYTVRGPSMNAARRPILDGDQVICVPYWTARTRITNGDVVVVERTRGQLKERTCKEVVSARGGFDLWPRSTDPRHQEPLHVGSTGESERDDETVELVGLVVSVQSNFFPPN